MSLRIMLAVLGVVFGIMWAATGIGWAIMIVCCALAGYYIGAVLESGIDLAGILAPLRRAP
jgi:hypothetical protein